jgi:hypothetical protein|tara:strand:- start:343 stop:648 length:306 start_codon:yes stop_codon:yes gene_type:complete
MEHLAVLEQARQAGLTVWVEGSDLRVKGQPTPQALVVVESLKEQKAEVLSFLRQYGDGQPPPLDRPLANEQELRRWMDWTADPEKFARWLEWAMNDDSTSY